MLGAKASASCSTLLSRQTSCPSHRMMAFAASNVFVEGWYLEVGEWKGLDSESQKERRRERGLQSFSPRWLGQRSPLQQV